MTSFKTCHSLFWAFAKIGITTFGGGLAMLPVLQRELVTNRGWVTEEELLDYYAIGQCTPGIIAVNTATFVGSKRGGIAGGICATFGIVFPSVVIISLIAAFLQNFAEYAVVQHAFVGIRAGVVALIASSVIQLAKASLCDAGAVILFIAVLCFSAFFGLSPILLIVLSGLAGYVIRTVRDQKKKEGKK